jgi:hypothetical protein
LAGAVGLFGGSHGYVVGRNHICGNSGQEYGGAISHFGASESGRISDNSILWNRAVDEGGGICIATETIAVCLSVNQASSIQLLGSTCESITIGVSNYGSWAIRNQPVSL